MKTPDEQRRIWPHIVFINFVTSFLDTATTYVGLRWFGGRELNPHTDTSSLGSMLYQESLTLAAICILSILSEQCIRPEVPSMAGNASFGEFSKKINKTWRAVPWFVLLVMYMIGLGRIVVVVSNSMFIVLGFSPYDLASQFISVISGITQETALLLLDIALMIAIMNPVQKILYRRIRDVDGIVAPER